MYRFKTVPAIFMVAAMLAAPTVGAQGFDCPDPGGIFTKTFVGQDVAGGGYDVGEGEWNVGANWSPAGVPFTAIGPCGLTGLPRVVIPAATRAVVAAPAPSSVDSIVVAGTLEVRGDRDSRWIDTNLPQLGSSLDGTIEIQAGGLLTTSSRIFAPGGWTIDGTVDNAGALITNGDLSGTGRIELRGDEERRGEILLLGDGEGSIGAGLEIEVLSGTWSRLGVGNASGTLTNRADIIVSGGDLFIGVDFGGGSLSFVNEGKIEVRAGRSAKFENRAGNTFNVENAAGALLAVGGDGASIEIGDTGRGDIQPSQTRRPDSFINNGQIVAGSGSALLLSGDSWDNTSLGSISAIDAAITVAGGYAVSDVADINRTNSSLELWGTADNAGGTFVVDNDAGQVSFARVTIDGTIDASNGFPSTDAFASTPTLVDVTWIGPFRPSQGFRVGGDSLTLQEAPTGDSSWVLPGPMRVLEPATAPQFTISGAGTIRTDDTGSATVAFCANALSTSGVRYELNGGSISGPVPSCPSSTTDPTITINGDIEVLDSSSLGFGGTFTTFQLNGDLAVPAGEELSFGGEQVTTAGVTTVAGTVRVQRFQNFSNATDGAAWSNTGDLDLAPGAQMVLLRDNIARDFPITFTNETSGVWTVPDGATVQAISNGPPSDSVVNRGRLRLGGTIEGTLQNFGMLLPGASPGTARIVGRSVNGPAFRPGVLVLEPSSTLMIDVDGIAAGSGYDQIVVAGDVALGGTLTVDATIDPGNTPLAVIVVTDISGEVGAPAQAGVTGAFGTPPAPPLFTFEDAVYLNAPPSLEAGDRFIATAGGWKPLTLVTAFLESTPVQVGQGTSDANGVVEIEVTVPAGFPPGRHTLVLVGVAPDDSPRRLSAPVRIPDPDLLLRSSFEPDDGNG